MDSTKSNTEKICIKKVQGKDMNRKARGKREDVSESSNSTSKMQVQFQGASDDDTQRRGDGQRQEEMRVDEEEGRIGQGPTEVWF